MSKIRKQKKDTDNEDKKIKNIESFISFIKENSAYISVIAVLKKYQKCGIGISLINRVINYFKNQDLEIYLDVELKNKTAINWYNKRGFIQII